MDNYLCIVSGSLFFAADIFAIVSLVMPRWIVSDVGGTEVGLIQTCLKIYGRDTVCFLPEKQQAAFVITFICLAAAIVCVSGTVILLVLSRWKSVVMKYARWLGFIAMVLFCAAAVIFPAGFQMDLIGGAPYQLPTSFRGGMSYIFFVLALWITVISELFAGKVCLPSQ